MFIRCKCVSSLSTLKGAPCVGTSFPLILVDKRNSFPKSNRSVFVGRALHPNHVELPRALSVRRQTPHKWLASTSTHVAKRALVVAATPGTALLRRHTELVFSWSPGTCVFAESKPEAPRNYSILNQIPQTVFLFHVVNPKHKRFESGPPAKKTETQTTVKNIKRKNNINFGEGDQLWAVGRERPKQHMEITNDFLHFQEGLALLLALLSQTPGWHHLV